MQVLKRESRGTRQQDHEQRIQQLERRIFPRPAVWAFADTSTPQTIPAGSAQFITFDRFWTGDRDVFRTTSNTPGDAQILSNEFGVYVVTSSVEWEDIGADYPHSHSLDELRLIGANLGAYGAAAATASELEWPAVGTNGPLDTGDVSIGVHSPWDYLSTQPCGWQILAFNGNLGSAVDVLRAFVMVVLLPSDEREQDYEVF